MSERQLCPTQCQASRLPHVRVCLHLTSPRRQKHSHTKCHLFSMSHHLNLLYPPPPPPRLYISNNHPILLSKRSQMAEWRESAHNLKPKQVPQVRGSIHRTISMFPLDRGSQPGINLGKKSIPGFSVEVCCSIEGCCLAGVSVFAGFFLY
jgi:hypothetical protein